MSFVRPQHPSIFRFRIQRGAGVRLWDEKGTPYFDFHSAYATVNQGHCHPRIVDALVAQAKKLTITSDAIPHSYGEGLGEKITKTFGYEVAIPMNTGTEACETAIKYARRWGYRKKGIPENEAYVVVAHGGYWGHSIAALSTSTEKKLRLGFGPYLPGFHNIPYGDVGALEEVLSHPTTAALMLEPIQGEAGIVLPPDGYLKSAQALCKKHNVLLICDEVQTGLGRTGRMTASEYEGIHPDIMILGKALSGGLMPISAVLCSKTVGDLVEHDEHHSTFSANPVACSVACAAIDVVIQENLMEKSEILGRFFRDEISRWNVPWIREVRGRGLLNAVEIDCPDTLITAVTLALSEEGIIALPLTKSSIRFSPPLVVTEAEMNLSLERIHAVFRNNRGAM